MSKNPYARPATPPPSLLGRYRQLSTTAGVHVSPLQLGAMSIGDKWGPFGMGEMDKESSFKLLDAYFDNGGNFIDTANGYQDETSELFIGEWAEKRGIRDQLFIATKASCLNYTSDYKRHDPSIKQRVLLYGNSVKSLHVSVNASLKKLRTNYIDLLYLHWWDWETSIEEVMRGLHNLVVQGKVLYLGISDTPAWVVARANQYARDHALTPFVIYQGAWSILERSFEREIIPMARAEGMALAPWNVLAGGKFRTDKEEEERQKSGEQGRQMFSPDWLRNDKEKAMSAALEKVANELGAKSITSVAIAYVMHKAPYVFPIIGGRKVEHLMQNIEALELSLSDEQIQYLESILPFEIGFPGWMVGTGETLPRMTQSAAVIDRQPLVAPIRPVPRK
ncbi:aryl-alcohol dehydrogenase [Coprinopsis cinerea okayama7|uniref:Aryl-alcohol dehydrogenase n=1 Tax=Coprinopsis cinerea (strain Okayama-7 / 130 / ATCC MYA-4618 / FGSC 9003) TaxID=240176 RepID=A8NSH5_COPC7|nr:aryl-alcohol dehydrogenase [Coprinopsis cinerea okayama7\|eukprot:XP_001836013.2 aryl-alcohol dehydrogenase [Coprinopsis cinerea okayama7\